MWKLVSLVGGPTVWDAVGIVSAVALWIRRRWRAALMVVVALAGAAALSTLLKAVVDRPRPVVNIPVAHALGLSFPSGHALTSFVAVGLFVVLVWPMSGRNTRAWVCAAGATMVIAIGFSRLILGVHFLSDVLGGWSVGTLWLAGLRASLRRLSFGNEGAGD